MVQLFCCLPLKGIFIHAQAMGMEPTLYHTSLVLDIHTFQVSYTHSGTNYVQKLEAARTSNIHYQKNNRI